MLKRLLAAKNGPLRLFYVIMTLMLLTAVSLSAAGCSDSHNDASGGTKLTGIIVNPAKATLAVGLKLNLMAMGVYSDGSSADLTGNGNVVWSSDNEAVVSVTGGVVTAKAPGSAVIKAALGSYSSAAEIEVTEAEPNQYIIMGSGGIITDRISIVERLSEQLHAYVILDDGTASEITDDVEWKSSKASVASFSASQKGLLKAVAAGQSAVAVLNGDGEELASFSAEVVKDAVVAVTLNKSELNIAAGYVDKLSASASFISGHTVNIDTMAVWTSSNVKVAAVSVESDAAVKGVAAGTAEVKVSFGGKSAVCKVNVSEAELVSLAFAKPSVSLAEGMSAKLSVIGGFSDGTTSDVTDSVKYTSADTGVAVVKEDGTVLGRAEGETVITAEAENGVKAEAGVSVTAAEVTGLKITGKSSVIPGHSLNLTAAATFADGTQRDVTAEAVWSSADTDAAMVTAGVVRAFKKTSSPVAITASYNGASAAKNITVSDAEIVSLIVAGDDSSVVAGYDITLTATAGYSDGTSADVTSEAEWTSGAVQYATVTAGKVTGVAAGSAAITAKLDGVSASKKITVKEAVIKALTIEGETYSVPSGSSIALTAKAVFSDGASNVDVTDRVIWKSGDTAKAVVSEGRVVGLAKGEVTISAVADGVEPAEKTVNVTDAELVSLAILGDTNTVIAGRTIDLQAMAGYSDGTSAYVTSDADWDTDTPEYASVEGGTVTGIAKGDAVIRASFNGIEAFKDITVSKAVVTALTVELEDGADAAVSVGHTVQLKAKATYSDGTSDVDVTEDAAWKSSDAAAAMVTQGTVIGVSEGEAVITASLDGVTSDPGLNITVSEPDIVSLIIIGDTNTVIAGRSIELQALAGYSNGSSGDITDSVDWDSTNWNFASVDNGTVSGIKAGTVTITAEDAESGLRASKEITVSRAVITALTVEFDGDAHYTIPAGRSVQLKALATYSDGTEDVDVTKDAAWKSSDAAVVMVAQGKVIGAAEGEAAVTAVLDGVTSDPALDFTVGSPEIVSLIITGNTSTVIAGRTIELQAIAGFSDGTSGPVTDLLDWDSSDWDFASVDNGTVTGIEAGTVTITAEDAELGVSASKEITVSRAVVTALTLEFDDDSTDTVPAGRTVQLRALAAYSNGESDIDVTEDAVWKSSNTSVAMVAQGKVIGVVDGTATITAVLDGIVSDPGQVIQVGAPDIVSLVITGNTDNVIAGRTIELQAIAGYSNGTSGPVTDIVDWDSDDYDTAQVDGEGTVTGIAAGSCNITAEVNGTEITASKRVTVTEAVVTELSIECDTDTVAAGNTISLRAMATYSDGTEDVDVTGEAVWTSGDNTKAMVTGGEVIGLESGEVTITAAIDGVCADQVITVSSADTVVSLIISGDSRVIAGYDIPLTATAVFKDGSTADYTTQVEWHSDDDSVAEVGIDTGIVTGVSEGTTVISALYSETGVDASREITVSGAEITDLVIEADETNVNVGGTIQLAAKATYSDGTDGVDVTDSVVWKSSDNSKAMVSEGTVYGISAAADVTITASVNGIEASQSISVGSVEVDYLEITGSDRVPINLTINLSAIVHYMDGTIEDVTDSVQWSSEDAGGYAAVEEGTGVVTGFSEGEALITADLGDGVSCTKEIYVFDAEVTGVEIQTDTEYILAGETVNVTAVAYFSNGDSVNINDDALWSNFGADDIAVVSRGAITGVGGGTADIWVSYGGYDAQKSFHVIDSEVTALRIEGPDTVSTLEPVQLSAKADFADGSTNVDVTSYAEWYTGDPDIAVAANGLVTGLAEGTVLVTASFKGVESEPITMTVERIDIAGITVNSYNDENTLYTGSWMGFYAIAQSVDGREFNISDLAEWSTDTPAYVTVTGNWALGETAGDAVITATFDGVRGEKTITVVDDYIDSLSIADPIYIAPGQTISVPVLAEYASGIFLPLDANQLNWSSGDTSIVNIVSDGLICGADEGTTYLTAALKSDPSKSVTVTVYVEQ